LTCGGGLDDRCLDGFLGSRLLLRISCGLDGLVVIYWVIVQFVVIQFVVIQFVIDILGGPIDLGWIRQRFVGRPQQAAEDIGELLSEAG